MLGSTGLQISFDQEIANVEKRKKEKKKWQLLKGDDEQKYLKPSQTYCQKQQ